MASYLALDLGHEPGDPLAFELKFFRDVTHSTGGPAFDDVDFGNLAKTGQARGEMTVAELKDALTGWLVEQAEEADAEAEGVRVDDIGVGEVAELVGEGSFAGGREGVEEAGLAAVAIGLFLGDPAAFEEALEKGIDRIVVELLLA